MVIMARVAKQRRIKRKARKARQRARWRQAFEAAIPDDDGLGLGSGAVFPEWLSFRPMSSF
jgi:hypothetical protein